MIYFSIILTSWNSLHKAFRGWLNEKYPKKSINLNLIDADPGNKDDYKSLNKFRLNGFKKAFTQTTIAQYKQTVKCNNNYCRDCN